jgi:hypothetical protein
LKGLTGYQSHTADPSEIESWPARIEALQEAGARGILSLGARCPTTRIGIDVDQYGSKRGVDQLRELESQFGPLPPAPVVTARDLASGSGIRMFRVPDGWRGQTNPTQHIELIQWFHRYLVVPPSFHYSGNQYRRFRRDGQAVASGILPESKAIPLLPDDWLTGLAEDTAKAVGCDATAPEVKAFSSRYDSGPQPQAVDWVIASTIGASIDDTRNPTRDALCWAAREAKGGRYGFATAVEKIRAAAIRSYANRGQRFSQPEFDRSVAYAVGQVRELSEVACADRWQSDAFKGAPIRTTDDDEDPFNQAEQRPIRALSTIAPKAVQWLWYGWLPLGKVSILEGESDVGKSTLTIAMAATVSCGNPWPTTVLAGGKRVDSQADPANVLLVGIEDDDSDTVVPRLKAAGADLDRVFKLERQTDADGNPVPFTIPRDVDWLRQAINEANAKLVVIDPISACMPEGTKHGVDSEIRRVLMHIVDLAAETGCAILLIRHFNKAQGMSAKNRGGGSVAYGALVRSVIQAGPLTKKTGDGATYALARAIGNLSKSPHSVGYSLVSSSDDEEVPVVQWRGTIDMTADQLVGADNAKFGDSRKNAPLRDAAKQTIRELLRPGPMAVKTVIDKVRLNTGCGEGTVQKAAKEMGVIRATVYDSKGEIDYWTWELTPAQKMIQD